MSTILTISDQCLPIKAGVQLCFFAFSNLLSRQRTLSISNAHWYSAGAAVVLFLLGLAVIAHVSDLLRDVISARHKQEAAASLTEAHARLEGLIGEAVATGRGIRSHIVAYPNAYMTQSLFTSIVADLVESNPLIKQISLAPNNVVSTVYPLEKNQKLLGMNLRFFPDQWPSVREAMIRRSEIVSGPHESGRGGQVIVARVPIFQETEPSQPLIEQKYWGVVSVVLDESSLIDAVKMSDRNGEYRMAIIAQRGENSSPSFIYGDKSIRLDEAVSLSMDIFDTLHWRLVAYPLDGWRNSGSELWATRIVGLLLAATFAVMAFFLILEVLKTRSMALHDPMTGLANRRLLEDRMSQLVTMYDRHGTGFDIFYLDLNDFKPINDTYGHSVGDQLLIEVGRRLKGQTREMDTVARVGGDEFIVLAPGGMTFEHRMAFVDRLAKRANLPFKSAGIEFGVRVSIGSASFPGDAASVEDLLRVADARMYAHKAKARRTPASAVARSLVQTG